MAEVHDHLILSTGNECEIRPCGLLDRDIVALLAHRVAHADKIYISSAPTPCQDMSSH